MADGGTTNVSGGWLKGLEQLRTGQPDEAVRRIPLLTDGLANVGTTEPGALVGLAEQARQAGRALLSDTAKRLTDHAARLVRAVELRLEAET
jgi:secreted protein with Ig-like and vWFA domain